MEVKINKEIRNYTESMFFGLSLRQFIFSLLACGVAVGLYFILRPYFGTETLSWVCILGAAPFAVMGFVKYNGMTAEQFVWAWVKSEFLMPKKLMFNPDNLYYETLKTTIQNHEKGICPVAKKSKKAKPPDKPTKPGPSKKQMNTHPETGSWTVAHKPNGNSTIMKVSGTQSDKYHQLCLKTIKSLFSSFYHPHFP